MLQFGSILKKVLGGRGLPVDHGCRIQVVNALHTKNSQQRGEARHDSDLSEPITGNVYFFRKQSYRVICRKQAPKCYSCGSLEYFIRFCPNRHSSACGKSGHKPMNSPMRDKSALKENSHRDHKRTVYQVSTREEAATGWVTNKLPQWSSNARYRS